MYFLNKISFSIDLCTKKIYMNINLMFKHIQSEEPYEEGLHVKDTSSFDERSSVTGSSGLSMDPSPSWILRAHCNPVSS